MLSRANRSRFISDKAVINALTGQNTLPATLHVSLAKSLGLSEGIEIRNLSKVLTRGVGGTQCRPYIITFNNDEKLFLKLSPKMKDAATSQKQADKNILDTLKGDSHPFVCMNHVSYANENGTYNELLFFPFVPGDNLFITTSYKQKDDSALEKIQFAEIGKCLADMHINCMKKNGTYETFLATDGLVQSVLVHDDWQSTNIMITPENKAIIIDTEGTALSTKPYKNLAESWELTGKKPELMRALLEAYIKAYPVDLQEKVNHHLQHTLSQQYAIDFSATNKVPKSP